MDVVETIKMVAELGFMAVAAGLLLFISYRMLSKSQEFQENLMKKYLEEGKKEDHPSADDFKDHTVIDNKIYQEMKGLMNALDADRTYVVLYHNGGKSSSGYYFQKMSCICELVHSGISSMSSNFQNIHRASYAYMIDLLVNDGQISIEDYNIVKDLDSFLFTQLVDRHVVSVYMKPLKDGQGNHIGFVGLDYCSQNKKFTKYDIMKLMTEVSTKVSALVDVRDEVK